MKELKKLLAEQAPAVLPDERVKQNIRRELGYEAPAEREATYAHGGTAAVRGKKTLWIAVAAGLLAVALALGILLPVFLRTPAPHITLPGDKFLDIKSTDDFYAYGAASVGSILSARESGGQAAAAASAQAESAAALKSVTAVRSASLSPSAINTSELLAAAEAVSRSLTQEQEAIAETINGYMALVEELLSEGAIEHETAAAGGEYAQYAYHTTVWHTDLLGVRIRSDLYYDMTPLGAHVDGDETEEYYAIEGVLVPENGVAYPMEGRREAESEYDGGESETESETQFTAYLNEARTAYIRMEQESSHEAEEGETETQQRYVYIYNDGTSARWTERTVVE